MKFYTIMDIMCRTKCIVEDPEEYDSPQLQYYKGSKEKLFNTLTDEQKELFKHYLLQLDEQILEVQLRACERAFLLGYNLGTEMEQLQNSPQT